MAKIKIELTDEEKKEVDAIWNFTKQRMNEKTRKALGWDSEEAFLADVLRFGLEKSSDDPIAFIRSRILERFPVAKKEEIQKFKEELARIYA